MVDNCNLYETQLPASEFLYYLKAKNAYPSMLEAKHSAQLLRTCYIHTDCQVSDCVGNRKLRFKHLLFFLKLVAEPEFDIK